DYDLQVALMEALCRMTSRAQRRELADQWFSIELVASAFTKIQDSEFETDCRKFLNLVNGMQGDDQSVYSYPCLEVFLDKHALLMPVDENLQEFWIDFNLGSQSISFYFCLADDEAKESQWDTLCITENEVQSYTLEEEQGVKVLHLVLTEPVCLSSIEGTRLTIHFSSSLDILSATKKVYGDTKNKKITPLRSKVSESCMYVSGSAGRKLGRSSFSCVLPASAEKNASLPRSPLTPLQPLCISPVDGNSSPLELNSHLRGIEASSFFKTSGGLDSATRLPHSSVRVQSAQEQAELSPGQSFGHPLIASTGKEKCSSLLNSPDLEANFRGFLNTTSQGVLPTCFDKESAITLVTLSQSSHTSMNNIAMICTELEKTPASVQRSSVEKAESGPATPRTRPSTCNSTSLSEQDDSEDEDKRTGPSEFAFRMKPRKLFKTAKQQSKKKGFKQPMQVDSSGEEEEKEKRSDAFDEERYEICSGSFIQSDGG
ncbi:synaptonemal complex protein 2-like isoform X3, partial [Silurus asotus]